MSSEITSANISMSFRRKPDVMAKLFVALLVLVAVYAAEGNMQV